MTTITFYKDEASKNESLKRKSEEETRLKVELKNLLKYRKAKCCGNCFHSIKNSFNETYVFCGGHNILAEITGVCETFSPKDK